MRYFVVRGTDAGAAARESLDRQYFGIAPSTQLTVRITHSSTTIPAPETILEFSPSLDLLRADFSDGYWPWHRELEREGRLSHRQADCPDRTGPRIEDWSSPARVTLAGVRRAP